MLEGASRSTSLLAASRVAAIVEDVFLRVLPTPISGTDCAWSQCGWTTLTQLAALEDLHGIAVQYIAATGMLPRGQRYVLVPYALQFDRLQQ